MIGKREMRSMHFDVDLVILYFVKCTRGFLIKYYLYDGNY
jgi:hypothetical protein